MLQGVRDGRKGGREGRRKGERKREGGRKVNLYRLYVCLSYLEEWLSFDVLCVSLTGTKPPVRVPSQQL